MKSESKGSNVQTCPSFRSGHLPAMEDVQRLRSLVDPHVQSFNYFLEVGLERGSRDIEPAELDIIDPDRIRNAPSSIDWNETTLLKFWVEHVRVSKPVKAASTGQTTKLLPRECRERGLMYAGPLTGDFCYRVIQRRNGVEMPSRVVRQQRSFGNMPIMVMSKGCYLEGMSPEGLVKLKEEVRRSVRSITKLPRHI